MITYILSNGMLAAGNIEETLFYAGRFYETLEDMEGSRTITDSEDNELQVVGMMEDVNGYTLAIYAENEQEYDTIKEHLSLNPDDVREYKRFYNFNDHVFFGYGWETEEVSTYNLDGSTTEFNTLKDAQQWANVLF